MKTITVLLPYRIYWVLPAAALLWFGATYSVIISSVSILLNSVA